MNMTILTAVNAFIGKTAAPTERELATALGKNAKAVWDKLILEIGDETGANVQEWNSYSPKHGWALRLKRAKRNIVYFIPFPGAFQVAFTLGEKAMQAARDAKLPAKDSEDHGGSAQIRRGNWASTDVERAEDVEVIKKLAMIKVKN
jgi:hypothetical protein